MDAYEGEKIYYSSALIKRDREDVLSVKICCMSNWICTTILLEESLVMTVETHNTNNHALTPKDERDISPNEDNS